MTQDCHWYDGVRTGITGDVSQRAAGLKWHERDLRGWQFVARFLELLDQARATLPPTARESHGLRQLHAREYLALFLLGVFNPIVQSMRGLCAASGWRRVQEEVCGRAVPPSRFSEAQQVFDPELLRRVMTELVRAGQPQAAAAQGGRFNPAAWRVVDSTLWKVVPRMAWAQWRHQSIEQRAVRLHIKLRLSDGAPVEAAVTNGKGCERAALRARLVPGEIYLGDRYYGEDYGLFAEMEQKGCGFLLRLRREALLHWESEEPLDEPARAAGIVRAGVARLGTKKRGPWRVIWIERAGEEPVILVASASLAALSALELAELYRQRWQVELFFRWLKCLLPCQHWLAQSERGVTFQIYLSLICALLLAQVSGCRPTRRMLELLAFHQMGWASEEELAAGLARELARAQARGARAKKSE